MSQETASIASPEHLALLKSLAQQAAAWWRTQLKDPGYLGKFNNGDTSRAGELGQIMASMAALKSPGPGSEALDCFEQFLFAALWQRMEREPCPSEPNYKGPANDIVLSVDYGPEGLLREAAEAARVSGFPWKTTMWVGWDADPAKCYVQVRHGYGTEVRRLPLPEATAA